MPRATATLRRRPTIFARVMAEPFTLTVSVDERYRVLAPEVAGKYAGLLGGSAADGEALAAALGEAVTALVAGNESADVIELAFQPGEDGVEVQLTCGERSAVVSHSLLASKD